MIGVKQNYTRLAHQLQIQFTDKCGVLCGWLEENRTCAAVTLKLCLPVVGHYVMTCHKFTYNNGTQSVLPHWLVDLNKNSIIYQQDLICKTNTSKCDPSTASYRLRHSMCVLSMWLWDTQWIWGFFCLYFIMIFPYSLSVSRHSFLSVCKVLVYQKFFRFFDTLWWFYTLQPKCLFSHGCRSFHVWICVIDQLDSECNIMTQYSRLNYITLLCIDKIDSELFNINIYLICLCKVHGLVTW